MLISNVLVLSCPPLVSVIHCTLRRYSVRSGLPQNPGIPLNLFLPKIKLFQKSSHSAKSWYSAKLSYSAESRYYVFSVFRKVQLALEIANYELPLNTKLQFNTSYITKISAISRFHCLQNDDVIELWGMMS